MTSRIVMWLAWPVILGVVMFANRAPIWAIFAAVAMSYDLAAIYLKDNEH